ncbi:MAG: hypothetical protein TEF_10410 [Rhizobiales bacterium NRL2]|jgi:ABC-type sugar transport system substrate-binding protein|nr:MAG: hypothetical protein TEF_10410 [Rhizobiales bacterium NRL2]
MRKTIVTTATALLMTAGAASAADDGEDAEASADTGVSVQSYGISNEVVAGADTDAEKDGEAETTSGLDASGDASASSDTD